MPGDAPPEGAADTRVVDLEAKLAAANVELEKAREDWLRAKAETDNIRRRGQEDVAKAHRFGLENFASALLAVKDSLDAALTVENTSVESFKEGVELTNRQLVAAFQKFAIKEVVPQGEKFDPHRHQAISQVESEEEPGTVVTVLQKGYLLHDRVLRPALVIVARAKDAPAA
ncbi:MAG TPA: nucleotide exchange factor GrpE [Usitatibacter sp.]|nr:nucleotide exchange factor GrpE [Usitatibacter sp.]